MNDVDFRIQCLVDYTACLMYSIIESDEKKDLKYNFDWFLDHVIKYDNTEHDGDCTQKPYSCNQCIIDSYRDKASLVLNKEAFIRYIIDEELIKGIVKNGSFNN